jgi:hypothetical protein
MPSGVVSGRCSLLNSAFGKHVNVSREETSISHADENAGLTMNLIQLATTLSLLCLMEARVVPVAPGLGWACLG